MDDHFTQQMRDRQARGKDPYRSGDGSDDGNLSDRGPRTGSKLRLGKGRCVISLSLSLFSLRDRKQKERSPLTNNPCLLPPNSSEKEDYARVERRQQAIAFLDNPELLIMYAQSTGDVSNLSSHTHPL